MTNPYLLPDDDWNRTINFSGGRSSGYMLHQILEANGTLPESVRVVFCNTGKEHPATLDFVQECGSRWGVEIDWLEYRYLKDRAGGMKDPKNVHVVVNHNTASRQGEPFLSLIHKANILPNAVMRKCTTELKIETMRRFCRRDLGWSPREVRSIVGIRYDEPRRWQKALMTECLTEYPMVHARHSIAEVTDFWEASPFDLGIPSHWGNCDLCFLKATAKIKHNMRENPAAADWWIDAEEGAVQRRADILRKVGMARFSKRWTYRELRDEALAEPDILIPGYSDDDDCFCAD